MEDTSIINYTLTMRQKLYELCKIVQSGKSEKFKFSYKFRRLKEYEKK